MKIKYNFTILLLFLTLVLGTTSYSQNKKFIIILDAGHGGKDPGNSYHGFKEKDIALKTTLKVGKQLEKDKDFKVIYTRVSDEFIELAKRPKIANKNDAHLFVSIHCNSVKNFGPSGTETFVMGLSRTGMNLEVAKSENSVIYLEDNYKETYKGFNPKNPESLLGLTIMQEDNLNSSINLANKIQSNFTHNLKRKSRGVKQQPLWVLDAAYMPSVLIELGFLSNLEEGKFLNSDAGQEKMANEIADAIINYKNEYFGDGKTTGTNESVNSKKEVEVSKPSNPNEVIFKVQIAASAKKLELASRNFKGLNNISLTKSSTLYKYFYGATASYEEAKKMQEKAVSKGYKSAFVVAFKNEKSVNVNDVVKNNN
ncbi:N-acetylmuramoyl-L-alanine amidase [Flavobacterium sp.]|jgi:N-acetylmuramoyl-L-alanine amidase|uniref:N-acetylmuramoyl-L-alanine amidase n=1 Tax=Flavobacterium sp. TaxID=239 RepID=UPI0037BEADCC